MKTINIELSFNSNRPNYAYFAMYQVLDTLEKGYNVNFYVITNGITEWSFMDKLKEKFPTKLKNYFTVDFKTYLENVQFEKIKYEDPNTYWTNIVMARMYMWDMFPTLKRFIHLDDDVYINQSISKMWEYDKESPLLVTKTKRIWMAGKDEVKKYDINDWFNGGVWRMDLDYWKKNDMYNKSIICQKEDKIETIVDERIMNIIYQGIYTSPDDNRFNYIPVYGLFSADRFYNLTRNEIWDDTLYAIKKDVVIVHWASGCEHDKPWKDDFFTNKYSIKWVVKYKEFCDTFGIDINKEHIPLWDKYLKKKRLNLDNIEEDSVMKLLMPKVPQWEQ